MLAHAWRARGAPLLATDMGIYDSLGFRIPRRGFQIPGMDSSLFRRNSDSGFPSLVRFRLPSTCTATFQALSVNAFR